MEESDESDAESVGSNEFASLKRRKIETPFAEPENQEEPY